MIRFEEITNKNIWKVCMLEPFEEQKVFVAENIEPGGSIRYEKRRA